MSENEPEKVTEQKKSKGEESEEEAKAGGEKVQNSSENVEGEEQKKFDYEQNKKEIMEKIEIRKQQADLVEKYIYETGIGTSFQIIFSELISKKIPVENYYTYTASRLRQIGREKEALERKNKNK